jgi:hypothetical protein
MRRRELEIEDIVEEQKHVLLCEVKMLLNAVGWRGDWEHVSKLIDLYRDDKGQWLEMCDRMGLNDYHKAALNNDYDMLLEHVNAEWQYRSALDAGY